MSSSLASARGYFWWGDEEIPEGMFAPPTAVTGALEIGSTGVTQLRLDATLPRRSGAGALGVLVDDEVTLRSICGILAGTDEYVLLTEIRPNGARVSTQGPSNEGMVAYRCLMSRTPLSATSVPRFTSLRLPLSGLEEWLGLRSIEVETEPGSFTAKYKQPTQRLWTIDQGQLVLELDLPRPMGGRSSKLSLSETADFRFSPNSDFDVEGAITTARRIEDLIILLTDCERGLDFPILMARDFQNPIKLYFGRLERSRDEFQWHACWTRFPEIADAFGSIVESWLQKHETFGPGFHLYLGNRRGMQLYPEHRFASFIWGLESLHRRLFSSGPNPRLSAKVVRILAKVDAKDRKWAKRVFEGAGEPPLADRLGEMFNSLPLDLDRTEVATFTALCATRRNDISHVGGERTPGLYKEFLTEIMKLNEALDVLYHARILQEIGVADSIIRWWFLHGFRSYRIRQSLIECGLTLPVVSTS